MTMLTLKSRIRDAELSVRTSNLLCKKYGEDVTFESFVNPGPNIAETITLLGHKGFSQFQEVLRYAKGGSALMGASTKTLRDEFAMSALPALLRICGRDSFEGGETYPAYIGRKSYEIADAMMKAREK